MTRLWLAGRILLALVAFGAPPMLCAQSAASMRDMMRIANDTEMRTNITYRVASGVEQKLDIYQPRGLEAPNPVVLQFHGGGWTTGSKNDGAFATLPFLAMGWTVVNVEYRMTDTAPAPAAVEDARCALRWVYRNAKAYHFDTTRIVTMGQSAGGHLALISGMLPATSPFDATCPGDRTGGASAAGSGPSTEAIRVAAIIDWYGISDVAELLDGPTRQSYAVAWLGALPDPEALARQVSPVSYVRPGIPPIISIHGDMDTHVPYAQKVRFHEMLAKAGLPHELVTIRNGKHGGFDDAEMLMAYERIRAFLARNKLPTAIVAARGQ